MRNEVIGFPSEGSPKGRVSISALIQSGNDRDNRVAAVDHPFVNALSATPRSSLGYPPFCESRSPDKVLSHARAVATSDCV